LSLVLVLVATSVLSAGFTVTPAVASNCRWDFDTRQYVCANEPHQLPKYSCYSNYRNCAKYSYRSEYANYLYCSNYAKYSCYPSYRDCLKYSYCSNYRTYYCGSWDPYTGGGITISVVSYASYPYCDCQANYRYCYCSDP